MDESKNLNNALFVLALLVLFGLGYLFSTRSLPRNSTIQIESAPKSSAVTIDGRPARNGDNQVVSGQHKVSVSRAGFATQSKSITTQPGDNIYAGFVLEPSTSATKDWYDRSQSDQKLAEGISSHIHDHESDNAVTQNSLLQILPYSFGDGHGGLITVSYGQPATSKTSQPAINITAATPQDRQTGLEWIRTGGYNPADMDIVFLGTNFGFNTAGGE